MFKKKKENLLPKDLLNDLVREEQINKRIKEQLDKHFDQPVGFANDQNWDRVMASSSTFLSTAMPMGSFISSVRRIR